MSSCTATLFFPLGLPATCISHSGPNDACVVLLWTASWGLQPNTSTVTMSARVGRWICMSASLFFSLRLRLSHFCTASPPLSLASIAMCTRHSGQNAAYALLWASTQPSMLPCQLGLRPVQDCVWGSPSLSFLLAFRCLNVCISQTCLCVEHRIICWIIVVQGEKPRSFLILLWCSHHSTILIFNSKTKIISFVVIYSSCLIFSYHYYIWELYHTRKQKWLTIEIYF